MSRNSNTVFGLSLGLLALLGLAACRVDPPAADDIQVINPKRLGVSSIPAQRVPVGVPGDYKPCVAMMPDGELLLVAFHQNVLTKQAPRKVREYIVLFRSQDGGVTWGQREVLAELVGREPYLTVLKDGTAFISVHLLGDDIRNPDGHTHSYLHRSDDGAHTWTTTRVGPDGFAPKAHTITGRNVLEMTDGTLLFGVDSDVGPQYLWRSTDRGKSWDRSGRVETGFKSRYAYFGEAVLWLGQSGRLFNLVRVDSHEFPIQGRAVGKVPEGRGDNADHLVLYESPDGGKSFRRIGDLGDYGQMYPSILRLADGRLLLTFTQRELKPPLGLRAVLGEETSEGIRFDYENDLLMLDTKTPVGRFSGGGFGRTVQLQDGTLVSSYSYRGADDKTYLEVLRWKLPPSK